MEQFIQNIEQISGYTSEKVRNMVIDELLKSGDSLRAWMQIADSVNVAKSTNDSVPNFKMMNDALIALADNECRAKICNGMHP